MNERSDFFKVVDFGDGILRLEGSGSVYCYLVEGRQGALLIDTMTGLGNLRAFVKKLPRLPLTVVCTHGTSTTSAARSTSKKSGFRRATPA